VAIGESALDRKLAKEIHQHLLEASDALWEAERAGQELKTYRERKAFNELMAEAITPLHSRLMPALYAEHPQLRPAHAPSHISSLLRWEDVSLPGSITEADIDSAIFAALKPNSLKVARIITDVVKILKERELSTSFDIIGARILALAEAGRIEGYGDLQRWMHSEVSLLPRG
jgi:hypothetical protein